MGAREHEGPERRQSGPGLGWTREEAADVIDFLRAVKAERQAQQQPTGKLAWLVKPGLAAGFFVAVLAAQAISGMAGCQRVMDTAHAMERHLSDSQAQDADIAKLKQDVVEIKTDVRWMRRALDGRVSGDAKRRGSASSD
jgi:hypothetical protein